MRFELVSPERRLASQEATAVRIPGADGDMTAMGGHAPVIVTLRPGVLTVEGDGGTQRFAVTGGFAEIGPDATTVLAERALPAEEMGQETFDEWVADVRRGQEGASDDAVDAAAKVVADMVAMGGEIGLSSRQPNL